MPQKPKKTIVLVGNPNCGKTTLYNLLTKSGEAVGNRAGVTFAPKAAPLCRFGAKNAEVVDLPGIYSLSACGNEEKVAARYLSGGRYDVVLNIADAGTLDRSLCLTLSLMARGLPVVLALNMMDEAEKEHLHIDIPALSRRLGIPVFPISAARGDGISALVQGITEKPIFPARPLRIGETQSSLFEEAVSILRETVTRGKVPPSATDRIDKVLCRPLVGVPFFFGVIFLVFTLTFSGFGKWLTSLLEALFAYLGNGLLQGLLRIGVSNYACRLVTEGIFHGVFSVLSFLPQTAILFLLLAVLEDSGYMARAAFVMDGALRPFGLSGKAFIPILIGFGCTVPAVMSASTLSEKERETALFSLPFIPCTARFPVFILIISAFFKRYAALTAFLLYLFGIAVSLFSAYLHTAGKKERQAPPLVIELPRYRMPRPRSMMREVGSKLRDFTVRAGTTVFLCSVLVFLFSTLTPTLSLAETAGESILARFGAWFAPLFSLIGLSDGRFPAALFAGIFAKEAIVSTLEILMPEGIGAVLSTASAAAFAVFSLLYAPCVATVSAVSHELGRKKALLILCRCLLIGFTTALFVYRMCLLFAGSV